jgi:hypothetical protein
MAVSAGAGEHSNEDLAAVHEHGGVTDILVIDGGTSVAERNYAHPVGDVAWFVRHFAAGLAAVFDTDASQDELVMRAVGATRTAYLAHTRELAVPRYAWPIAALSWIRIEHGPDADTLHLYCLGDCKLLLAEPDGRVRDLDPWVNPQEDVLRRAIAGLQAEGVSDPAARRARLLPLLRRRREEQNADPAPGVLCLEPAGPFGARKTTLRAAPGATLLAMTDGFYRLADPYALYSPAHLLQACVERGVGALLAELRALEAGGGVSGVAVKSADDASAVMWTRAEGWLIKPESSTTRRNDEP